MSPLPPQAVLFDLDGTLIDSAPDLVAAVNALRHEQGLVPAEYTFVREAVSRGGRALLRRGFPDTDEAHIEQMLPRLLDLYAERLLVGTYLYPGILDILNQLEVQHIHWGIVTNKPGWLARPLIKELGLDLRCAAFVSGDCLSVRKPDPAPVLKACEMLSISPENVIFVGDDERDVIAGRAAGTRTVVAAYGYLDGANPLSWEADDIVHTPPELMRALGLN